MQGTIHLKLSPQKQMSKMAKKRSKYKPTEGIHGAVYQGDYKKVKQSLHEDDINRNDKEGWTPLMLVLLGETKKSEKNKMVVLLLENGANANARNKDGDTILHIAVRASIYRKISLKSVKNLLDYGADCTALNKAGKTAGKLAYEIGNAKIGDFLLFYDPNPTLPRDKNRPGFFVELLSCMFPSYSFCQVLDKDVEKIYQRERKKLRAENVYSKTPKAIKRKNKQLECICLTTEETAPSTQTSTTNAPLAIENGTALYINMNDIHKAIVSELCNGNIDSQSQAKYIPVKCSAVGAGPASEVRSARLRRSNVHQLSHIGNESSETSSSIEHCVEQVCHASSNVYV